MWKKEKKGLEATIDDLKASIENLKRQLVNAKVLQGRCKPYHYYDQKDTSPISLIDLENQIEGIKDFLGIELVTKPSIPAKSCMERLPSTDDDGGY
jgi:hypothetical protein